MSARARIVRLTALLIACLLLTGCWDSKELDTLFIVTGIGLDTAANEDKFEMTVQVGKVGQAEASGKAAGQDAYILMRSESQSVYTGIEYLRSNSTRNLFLEHNQVIVIGRELADRGIEPFLDFFMRDLQTRMEVWVLISDEKAVDILDMELDVDSVTGVALSRVLQNRTKISQAMGTRLLDVVSNLVDGTSATTIPLVEKVQVGDSEKLFLNEMAIFKVDKMVGTFDGHETLGYMLAKSDVRAGAVEVDTEDGKGILRIRHTENTIDPVLYRDGGIRVNVTIDADLLIGELVGLAAHTIDDFENALADASEDRLEELVLMCTRKAAELNADVFGIGVALEKKYPGHWENYRERWDELYPEIHWSVQANARIIDDGRIATPLTMEEDLRNDNAGW